MLKCFIPKLYLTDIFALPIDELREQGISALVLDLDNTLTFWHDDYIRSEVLELLRSFEAQGFKLCLLSNNRGYRVEYMANRLGITFVKKALKPAKRGYIRACAHLGVRPHQAAMIGDQLLTDIRGANRAGLLPVLVKPMGEHEMWWTMHISRRIEKLIFPAVLRELARRGIEIPE